MSQNATILFHLQSGRSLTSLEAINLYGITRLGGRIFELKQQGHVIHDEFVTVKNRHGKDARVKRYWIAQPEPTFLGRPLGAIVGAAAYRQASGR